MVRRLMIMLALVVLSAGGSKSYGLPPDFSLVRHSPYAALGVAPYTRDLPLLQTRRDVLLKALENAKDSKLYKDVVNAYDLTTNPERHPELLRIDLNIAEARLQSVNYYEALHVSPFASTEEIQKAIEIMRGATDTSSIQSTLTPDEQKQVRTVQTKIKTIETNLIDVKNRAAYDQWLANEHEKKIQEMKEPLNPLHQELTKRDRFGREVMMFGAGQLGFMIGNSMELCGTGWFTHNKAIQWACWDSWRDFQGFSSLFAFGFGTEAWNRGSAYFMENFLKKGPNAPTNFGLIAGSVTSNLWGKFYNNKERKVFANYFKENAKHVTPWGETVIEREYELKRVKYLTTYISHLSPNDPNVVKAKADLEDAKQKYTKDVELSTKLRNEYLGAFGSWMKSYNKSLWDWENLKELGISVGRMYIVVKGLDELRGIWQAGKGWYVLKSKLGLRKAVIENPDMLKDYMSKMKPEDRLVFDEIFQKLQYINDLKANFPESKAMIDTLVDKVSALEPQQADVVFKTYRKYVFENLSNKADQIKPAMIRIPVVKGRNALRGINDFFWPETAGNVEITDALGRRVMTGNAITAIVASAWSAIPFLFVQHQFDEITDKAWDTGRLQNRLEESVSKIPELTSRFVYNHDLNDLAAIRASFSQYQDVWGKYRASVIGRDVMEDLSRWQTMRQNESHSQILTSPWLTWMRWLFGGHTAHDNYLEAQWLNWMLRGSSLTDQEFLANGGDDENAIWHVDPEKFPLVFQSQREDYGSIIKPWDTQKVKDYLAKQQDKDDFYELPLAVTMHEEIKPKLSKIFFSNGVPAWLNTVNNVWDHDATVLQNIKNWFIPDMDAIGVVANSRYMGVNAAPILNSVEAAHQAPHEKLKIPGNYQESFDVEIGFLHQRCRAILGAIPFERKTYFSLQLEQVCSTDLPIMQYAKDQKGEPIGIGYSELLESDLYSELSGLLSGFPVIKDPDDYVDAVAVALADTFMSLIDQKTKLPLEYQKLMDQPENPQQAQQQRDEEEKKRAAQNVLLSAGDQQTLEAIYGKGTTEIPKPSVRGDFKEALQEAKDRAAGKLPPEDPTEAPKEEKKAPIKHKKKAAGQN